MLTPQSPAFSFRPAYARRYAVGSRAKRESSYREFPPRRGGGGFAIDCKIARRPTGGETARPSDAESHSSRASRRKTQEGGGLNPLNLNSAARSGTGSISASDHPEPAAPARINSDPDSWLRVAMAWQPSRPGYLDGRLAGAAATCTASGVVQVGFSSDGFVEVGTGGVSDVQPR